MSPTLADPPEPIFRGLAGSLRRHRVLILSCVLLGAGAGVAYTKLATPMYDAGAVVRFEPELVNLPQLVQVLYTENVISTENEVLHGRSAAVAVIDALGLRARLLTPRRGRVSELFSTLQLSESADTGTLVLHRRGDGTFTVTRPNAAATLGFARVGDTTRIAGVLIALSPASRALPELALRIDPLDDAIRRLGASLTISRPVRDADLLAIHVRSADPVQAADIANLMANNLIADRQSARRGNTSAAVSFLQQQDDSLGRQLRAAEDSLRAYQQREHVIDVPHQADAEVERLAKLQADLAGVRAERDAFAALVAQSPQDSSSSLRGGQGASRRLMAYPSLLSNQAAATLLGSLAQAEGERSQLLIRRTPADSDVQVLTRRIRDIEMQIQVIAESYLQSLSNQVASLEREASHFSTQLDALPEKELQTARRERDAKVLNDLWVLVQTRLKEAQVTGAAGDPTVRIVDRAVAPTKPIRPQPLISLALSVVLGSLVGVSGALAREQGDHSVRSRRDVLSAAGLPVLAAFPRLRVPRSARALPRKMRPLPRSTAKINAIAPNNALGQGRDRTSTIASLLVTRPGMSASYVESFNQLFANLAWAYHEGPLKAVVFTSPLPGEGKTLSAINFALIGASRGLRMLLIDGDLRCGVIHAALGCKRGPGLAELLAGTVQPADVLHQVSLGEHGSLMVVPCGAQPRVPGRVLTLERVNAALGTLSANFDFVVIDTPPVNLLADAAVLGSAADAVLVVVRAGHTQADDLRYAIDQLASAGVPVLGTLLNDIDLRRNATDDGSYRYLADAGRYSVIDG